MANIIGALIGGAGAGVESYGRSTMQDEERKRAVQARLDEIARQNSDRATLAADDDARAAAASLAKRRSGISTMRLLHPEMQLPDDFDGDPGIMNSELGRRASEKALGERAANSEKAARVHEAGQNERARLGNIAASDRTDATVAGAMARVGASGTAKEQTREQYVLSQMAGLTKATRDIRGVHAGMSSDEAADHAGEAFDRAHGVGPSGPPAAAPGTNLLSGLGVRGLKPITDAIRQEIASNPHAKEWYAANGYATP